MLVGLHPLRRPLLDGIGKLVGLLWESLLLHSDKGFANTRRAFYRKAVVRRRKSSYAQRQILSPLRLLVND